MGEECTSLIIRNTDGARHPDRNPNHKRLGSSHSFAASKGVTHFLYEWPPSLLSNMLCEVTDLPMDVPYFTVDGNQESAQTVAVNQEELLSRMDPGYHLMMAHLKNVGNDFKKLGEYLDSCARGYGFYGDDRSLLTRNGDLEYIHSVDIRDFVIRQSPQRSMVTAKIGRQHQRALIRKGDLLLVRVGKGCVGRCAIVTWLTNAFASDCVYVLSSKRIDLYYLCLYLNTPFSKKYFDTCTRGVCSRYITKVDLMAMPLYLPEKKVIRRLSRAFKNILGKTSPSCVSEDQLKDTLALVNELNVLISSTIENGDR